MNTDDAQLTASLRRLISETPDSSTDVQRALQRVIEACVEIFDVSGSGMMVADEQNAIRYVAASDGPGRILERIETETGQGVCTEAFVLNRVVASSDLAAECGRWPDLAEAVVPHRVRAVLGVPVRLGGIPVGTLDVYRTSAHDWDDDERRALVRYSEVIETILSTALRAHTAAQLAGQLQYALDYRVVIERAVGYLMAREDLDAVTAFNRLRSESRNNRTKIGELAERLLQDGRLG